MKKLKSFAGEFFPALVGLAVLAACVGPDLAFLLKGSQQTPADSPPEFTFHMEIDPPLVGDDGDMKYSFDPKDKTIYARGTLGKKSIEGFDKILQQHPGATRLVLVDYGGRTFVPRAAAH